MARDTPIIVDTAQCRCRSCGAMCDSRAKYCWLCKWPIRTATGDIPKNTIRPDSQRREISTTLKFAPIAAIPTVALVIYGLAIHEPGLAIVCGPAMVVATLVALVHHFANREKTWGQSLLAGLIAGAITGFATYVIAVVIFVVFIVSVLIALKEFCSGLSNI